MAGKITYTPFIPKFEIPESQAIAPIPISVPISEYQGADSDREVIPIQYTVSKSKTGGNSETKESSSPFKWARLKLQSSEPMIHELSTKTNSANESA